MTTKKCDPKRAASAGRRKAVSRAGSKLSPKSPAKSPAKAKRPTFKPTPKPKPKAPPILHRNPPWRLTAAFNAKSPREYDWWHEQFRAPQAWKSSRGEGVVVAILDTGCDLRHSDLKSQIVGSKDFTGSPFGAMDMNSHGTHCAGLVAAYEDDKGVMGIAPDAKLLIGKVLGDDGSGLGKWIAKGIDWAITQGAHVISMSLGSPEADVQIIAACKRAIAAGITVVMAAGNEGHQGVGYPAAAIGDGIRVAAVDRNLNIADFSSRGPEVDIAGPGVDVLSCLPANKWGRMSGTSMATPVVAGVCALAIGAHKKKTGKWLTPAEVRKRIVDNADEAGEPGHDKAFGWGLIRPDRIVGWEEPVVAPPPPPGKSIEWGGLYAEEITYRGMDGIFIGKAPAKKTARKKSKLAA